MILNGSKSSVTHGHGNMQYYSTFSFILAHERTWKQIILNFRKVIIGSDNYLILTNSAFEV